MRLKTAIFYMMLVACDWLNCHGGPVPRGENNQLGTSAVDPGSKISDQELSYQDPIAHKREGDDPLSGTDGQTMTNQESLYSDEVPENASEEDGEGADVNEAIYEKDNGDNEKYRMSNEKLAVYSNLSPDYRQLDPSRNMPSPYNSPRNVYYQQKHELSSSKRNAEPVFYLDELGDVPVDDVKSPDRNSDYQGIVGNRKEYYNPNVLESGEISGKDRPVEYRRVEPRLVQADNLEPLYYDVANENVHGEKVDIYGKDGKQELYGNNDIYGRKSTYGKEGEEETYRRDDEEEAYSRNREKEDYGEMLERGRKEISSHDNGGKVVPFGEMQLGEPDLDYYVDDLEEPRIVQGHHLERGANCQGQNEGKRLKQEIAELQAKINIESEESEKYEKASVEAQKEFMEHRERFRVLHTEETIAQQDSLNYAQRATREQAEICRLEKMMCQLREKLNAMHTKKVELQTFINSRVKRDMKKRERDKSVDTDKAHMANENNAQRVAIGPHKTADRDGMNRNDEGDDKVDQTKEAKAAARQSCQRMSTKSDDSGDGFGTGGCFDTQDGGPPKNDIAGDTAISGSHDAKCSSRAPPSAGKSCDHGTSCSAQSQCGQKHPCKSEEELANEEKELRELKKLSEEIYKEEANYKLLYDDWLKKDRAVNLANKRLDTLTQKINTIKDNIRGVQQDAMTAWQRIKDLQERETYYDKILFQLGQQLDGLRKKLTEFRAGMICARNKRRERIRRRYRRTPDERKSQMIGDGNTFSDVFQKNLPGVESTNPKDANLASDTSLKLDSKT